ncbi:hypothetical protein [Pyrobaculum aerophilum]|uniref:lipopolysaccharide biosynthesis protein n=1 Tax=Pyrobaculum aerophilum TaxID=13773 RepID=UPI002FD9BB0C
MSVYKAGLWLYLANITAQLGGYVFWFIAAASVRATVLGEVAYTVTIATILTTLATLGVPTAMMRLLPASSNQRYAQGAMAHALVAATATAAIALWKPAIAILTVTGVIANYYTAYFQAKLDTKPIFNATLAGQAARIALAPILAPYGPDALATTYAIPGLLIALYGIVRSRVSPKPFGLRELIKAGISVWLPNAIAMLGTNLGVVTAYNLAQPEEAGYVYIAQVLANAATAPTIIITGVLLPYLSSLAERESVAKRANKLALAMSTPLAAVLILGGRHILALLGPQYTEAADALAVYATANTLSLTVTVLSSLVYSQGKYRHVLIERLASNAARVLLYALLGTSDIGVAASFLIGTVIALAYYSAIAKNVAKSAAILTPRLVAIAMPAAATSAIGILLAIPGIAISYALAVKMKIVTRREIGEIAQQVLPNPLYTKIAPLGAKILDILD